MEFLLKDGDYVPDGMGSLQKLTGAEEALQRVLFQLSARRGQFPLLPELGSELYRLGREKPSARQALAAQYVAQALTGEPEVEVQKVTYIQEGDRGMVQAVLRWRGETLQAAGEVEGQ